MGYVLPEGMIPPQVPIMSGVGRPAPLALPQRPNPAPIGLGTPVPTTIPQGAAQATGLDDTTPVYTNPLEEFSSGSGMSPLGQAYAPYMAAVPSGVQRATDALGNVQSGVQDALQTTYQVGQALRGEGEMPDLPSFITGTPATSPSTLPVQQNSTGQSALPTSPPPASVGVGPPVGDNWRGTGMSLSEFIAGGTSAQLPGTAYTPSYGVSGAPVGDPAGIDGGSMPSAPPTRTTMGRTSVEMENRDGGFNPRTVRAEMGKLSGEYPNATRGELRDIAVDRLQQREIARERETESFESEKQARQQSMMARLAGLSLEERRVQVAEEAQRVRSELAELEKMEAEILTDGGGIETATVAGENNVAAEGEKSQNNIPTINTQKEYDELPSGAQYRDSNGTIATKR